MLVSLQAILQKMSLNYLDKEQPMKPIIISLLLAIFLISSANAQEPKSLQIDAQTVIKNPEGERVSLDTFIGLMNSKTWTLEPSTDANNNPYIQLIKLSEDQQETNSIMERQDAGFNGIEVPYFNMIDRNGNLITSETTKGKVVVFNFWFASCPPCIKEVPELNEVYESYKGREDIVFAAITFEKEEKIKRFLTKYPLAYPIIGSEGTFSQSITRGAYPTNVIIGKDGVIQEYISGGMVGIGQQIKAAIEAAL